MDDQIKGLKKKIPQYTSSDYSELELNLTLT
jgi:hypothetical protein